MCGHLVVPGLTAEFVLVHTQQDDHHEDQDGKHDQGTADGQESGVVAVTGQDNQDDTCGHTCRDRLTWRPGY